ncbi:Soma ferritin [Halotydeus destructor]|nr:Soma ferritin [Halotydeus destructor]
MPSKARQNFADESVEALNKMINRELTDYYQYLSMAIHFNDTEIALFGIYDYFKDMSEHRWSRSKKLIKYQTRRGGQLDFMVIKNPRADIGSSLDHFEFALQIEKNTYNELLELYSVAKNNKDYEFEHFIDSELLGEQLDIIKNIGDKITQLNRTGQCLGEYIFDKQFKA